MSYYIRSASAISPQQSFESENFPEQIISTESGRFTAIEPDYKAWIDPKLIRRMSRIIRMGVATANQCLQKAGVQMPDAIITGTAYGCLEDTGLFLSRMVEQGEEMLSPTAFIQSTHNTVAAQIALLLHCHNYNNTFVHRGFSFESALLDASMLIEENKSAQILVGAADEITGYSHSILSRFGLYRQNKKNIAGEGAAFFLLSGQKSENDRVCLESFKTLYKPESDDEVSSFLQQFLKENNLSANEIDLVINGNAAADTGSHGISVREIRGMGKMNSVSCKQLCGEYPTSSSFALWLAWSILSVGKIPPALADNNAKLPVSKILIRNNSFDIHHSLMLISAC